MTVGNHARPEPDQVVVPWRSRPRPAINDDGRLALTVVLVLVVGWALVLVSALAHLLGRADGGAPWGEAVLLLGLVPGTAWSWAYFRRPLEPATSEEPGIDWSPPPKLPRL
jgi:hypothetical protein